MHTADLLGSNLLVFRGGDGRAYLNDTWMQHALAAYWGIEATPFLVFIGCIMYIMLPN